MKTFLKIVIVLLILGLIAGALLYKTPQRRAFDQTLALAQQGDAQAQLSLARMYAQGKGTKADGKQALEWFSKAAQQENATAAYELAQLYLDGKAVRRDAGKGLSFLKQAAYGGYAPAQSQLGLLYQIKTEKKEPQLAQAFFWWMQAAHQGDTEAQKALEQAQQTQLQLYQQVQEIDEVFQRAAAEDVQAMAEAGEILMRGDFLEKNLKAASSYILKAAQRGSPKAQYALSLLYGLENGPLPQDNSASFDYLKLAADGEYAPAQYDMGSRIYRVSRNFAEEKEAFSWFEKAGEQNNADALYMMGLMYLEGRGVPRNRTLSQKMFRKAANLGHPEAQYVIAQNYWFGANGVGKNRKRALQWMRLASQNGHQQAAVFLKEVGQ